MRQVGIDVETRVARPEQIQQRSCLALVKHLTRILDLGQVVLPVRQDLFLVLAGRDRSGLAGDLLLEILKLGDIECMPLPEKLHLQTFV